MSTEDWTSELGRVMAARQSLYQFLARAFRTEVDRELLSEIARLGIPADSGVAEIDRGLQLLGRFSKDVNETTLVDLENRLPHEASGARIPRP